MNCLMLVLMLCAQECLTIHQQNTAKSLKIEELDSLTFSTERAEMKLHTAFGDYPFSFTAVDSLSFSGIDDTVRIVFDGSSVFVRNPFAFKGVSVDVNDAEVCIQSSIDQKGLVYVLSGASSDGMCSIYSEKSFELLMDGLQLNHMDGPAVNIQSKKAAYITLKEGSYNVLSDGILYQETDEDQKACLFSEGQLIFQGTGALHVYGRGSDQHAICSDDYIDVLSGAIVVHSSVKDGVHSNDGFWLRGGSLEIQSSGDGIDTDSVLIVSGGILSVLIEGDGCKALKAEGTVDFSGGEVQVTTRGSTLLESTGVSGRYDPSYCTAIKGYGLISFTGATVQIQASGKGGKGVSSGLDFVQNGGYLSVLTTGAGASYTNAAGVMDAYQATAITSDAGISILDGTLIVSCSGSAAKGLNADGTLVIGTKQTSPQIQVEASGSSIVLSSGSNSGGFRPGGGGTTSVTAAEAKAIKCDGSVYIYNGVTHIYSADDGIKSQTSITMDGGSVSVLKSVEAFEAPVITVNGGTLRLLASDDCFNATYGNGGESNDGSLLSFYGGLIQAGSTGGDAIDSNGSVVMTGGTVVAQGPASSPEVGIDVNGSFKVTGGILVASGPSSQNMEGTTTFQTSTQPVLICTGSLGTNVMHLTDANAVRLLSFMPDRSAASLTLSTPALSKGCSYRFYVGGSVDGSNTNGLYLDGDYGLGTLKKTLTINSSAQTVSF